MTVDSAAVFGPTLTFGNSLLFFCLVRVRVWVKGTQRVRVRVWLTVNAAGGGGLDRAPRTMLVKESALRLAPSKGSRIKHLSSISN